jgi:hypothetical protein
MILPQSGLCASLDYITQNEDHRHAGTDKPASRSPADESRNVHVNLDSSSPCWNEVIEGFLN